MAPESRAFFRPSSARGRARGRLLGLACVLAGSARGVPGQIPLGGPSPAAAGVQDESEGGLIQPRSWTVTLSGPSSATWQVAIISPEGAVPKVFQLLSAEMPPPLESLRIDIRGLGPKDVVVHGLTGCSLGDAGTSFPFRVEDLARTREGLSFWVHPMPLQGSVEISMGPSEDAPPSEAELFAVPGGPAGDSSLPAVVLVHGYRPDHVLLPYERERNEAWKGLLALAGFTEAQSRVRFHRFGYRPWRPMASVGRILAARILREIPAESPLILVGYSAGALVARHAARDPRLAGRVRAIVSLAGAHRGSVVASLMRAGPGVKERLGWSYWTLLERFRGTVPRTPAEADLAFDNFDGSLDEAWLSWGLRSNPALLAFNRSPPEAPLLHCFMGEVDSLWGHGAWGLYDEIRRRMAAAMSPAWSSADPILHRASGLFEGVEVASRRSFPGRDHDQMRQDPEVLAALLRTILEVSADPATGTTEGSARAR